MKLKPLAANMTELELDNARILFSYETPVAAWVSGKGYLRTEVNYSQTTNRHISKWLDGAAAQTVSQNEINALVER